MVLSTKFKLPKTYLHYCYFLIIISMKNKIIYFMNNLSYFINKVRVLIELLVMETSDFYTANTRNCMQAKILIIIMF